MIGRLSSHSGSNNRFRGLKKPQITPTPTPTPTPTITLTPLDSTQLLVNPHFDLGTTGWSATGGFGTWSFTSSNQAAVLNSVLYFTYVSRTVSQSVNVSSYISSSDSFEGILNIKREENGPNNNDTYTFTLLFKNSSGTTVATKTTGSSIAPLNYTDITLTLNRSEIPSTYDTITTVDVQITGVDAGFWNGNHGPWVEYVNLMIIGSTNPTPTETPTPTSTETPTPTPTSTETPTPTSTETPTNTPTPTETPTTTPTPTPTNINNQGFSYDNFVSTDGLTLVGAAAVSGGTIIALTTTSSASVGNVYRTTAIQYNRNFSAQWSSFVGGGTGADGYCVQWTTTNNTNGTGGGGVGRIESSSTINAIGFYTFTNNNFQWWKNNISQSTTSVSAGFWRQQLYFWADYDNSAQTLELYYNTTNSKPGSPNITYSSFSFDTGSYYMGFGAAVGGSNDNHEILSWSLQFT